MPSAPTPSSFSPVPVSSDPRQPNSPSTETPKNEPYQQFLLLQHYT